MIEQAKTLKDIARLAHVSTATVSMALNNRPGVGEEKRREILKIAKNNGYQPNLLAKALISKRSFTLGLIINNISDQFYTELAKGIEETAKKLGYDIMLCSTNGDVQAQKRYLELMRSRGVDGIIISTMLAKDPDIGSLVKEGIPFVCLNRVPLNRQFAESIDYVTLDNFSAGYKGIEHLWKLGHDRIGIIRGDLKASNAQAIRDGAEQALADYGAVLEPALIRDGRYSRGIAQEEMKALMKLEKPPSAIFAHDDDMALAAREVILSMGLSIHEDMALMGIDDIEMGALTGVELSTISQKKYEMGEIGVKTVVKRIEEHTQHMVEKVMLKADLVIRKSCGFSKSGYKR